MNTGSDFSVHPFRFHPFLLLSCWFNSVSGIDRRQYECD